jgi:ribonuclease J
MLEAVNPKFFVPIHGEYRHLVHQARLAQDCGMAEERDLVATNGNVLEFGPDSMKLIEKLEEPRVFIEGREGKDVSKLVLTL